MQLGNWNTLEIVRFTDHGAYLDGADVGEILMPRAYVTPDMHPGDRVEVFVYLDQEERLVATTETPLAKVGDFAFLKVAWVNEYGAFLDWGLMKDVFVPFSEQKMKMRVGFSYLVHIHIDEDTHRIVASAKIDRYLRPATPSTHHRGQEVDVLVQYKTPLGFKVIVDNAYAGLIYDNQIYEVPRAGDRLRGTVVTVRDDGKLDISLQRIGKGRLRDFAEILLEELEKADGCLPFSDKSPSEVIAARFGVSKKTFKGAVGNLYKQRLIALENNSIKLLSKKIAEK